MSRNCKRVDKNRGAKIYGNFFLLDKIRNFSCIENKRRVNGKSSCFIRLLQSISN